MHHFNWFTYLIHGLSENYVHLVSALFIVLMLVLIALGLRSKFLNLQTTLVPQGKTSLLNIFEVLLESLYNLSESVIGHGAKKHFPLIATLFLFVFVSNLMGLIPGFPPPTSKITINFAIALCVFVYFNAMGIKEHGLVGYLKHFAGPLWWLAPLIFAIEMFGTFIRPVTLALRLFCNINADHLVLGIFSGLVPFLIPVVFMILGIFVAFVQAFVFTLLSMIYIALATAHEEHH